MVSTDFAYTCPSCELSSHAPLRDLGQVAACPQCGRLLLKLPPSHQVAPPAPLAAGVTGGLLFGPVFGLTRLGCWESPQLVAGFQLWGAQAGDITAAFLRVFVWLVLGALLGGVLFAAAATSVQFLSSYQWLRRDILIGAIFWAVLGGAAEASVSAFVFRSTSDIVAARAGSTFLVGLIGGGMLGLVVGRLRAAARDRRITESMERFGAMLAEGANVPLAAVVVEEEPWQHRPGLSSERREALIRRLGRPDKGDESSESGEPAE